MTPPNRSAVSFIGWAAAQRPCGIAACTVPRKVTVTWNGEPLSERSALDKYYGPGQWVARDAYGNVVEVK